MQATVLLALLVTFANADLEPPSEGHSALETAGMMRREDETSEVDTVVSDDGEETFQKMFGHMDHDGSGFLEENEIENVIEKAGLPSSFKWQDHDADKDGRWSLEEFTSAGREAMEGQEASSDPAMEGQEASSELETAAQAHAGQPDTDKKLFDEYDADGSGLLEEDEIEDLMHEHHIDARFPWRSFDHNQDGRWSPEEFHSAGNELESSASLVEKQMFEAADADKSSFLEEGEVHGFLGNLGVQDSVDWRSFDHDKDNRWSLSEFASSGEEVANVYRAQNPASLVEEDEDEDEEEEEFDDEEGDNDEDYLHKEPASLEETEAVVVEKEASTDKLKGAVKAVAKRDGDEEDGDDEADDVVANAKEAPSSPDEELGPAGMLLMKYEKRKQRKAEKAKDAALVLKKFDTNADGCLDKHEVKALMKSMKDEIHDGTSWHEFDTNHNGCISLEEYTAATADDDNDDA